MAQSHWIAIAGLCISIATFIITRIDARHVAKRSEVADLRQRVVDLEVALKECEMARRMLLSMKMDLVEENLKLRQTLHGSS